MTRAETIVALVTALTTGFAAAAVASSGADWLDSQHSTEVEDVELLTGVITGPYAYVPGAPYADTVVIETDDNTGYSPRSAIEPEGETDTN